MSVQIASTPPLDLGQSKHFLPFNDFELFFFLESMNGEDETPVNPKLSNKQVKAEESEDTMALTPPQILLPSSSSAAYDPELERAGFNLFYGDVGAATDGTRNVAQSSGSVVKGDAIPLPRKRKLDAATDDKAVTQTNRSDSVTSKSKRRRRAQLEVPHVPEFMKAKLMASRGHGEFTIPELLILLYYSQSLFDKPNVYAKLKEIMQNKRSRASIRRKIEKIVVKEAGIPGGLLKVESRQRTQKVLAEQFAKLVEQSEQYGNGPLKAFVSQLKAFVATNTANKTSTP